jgi:hypothetical protein
MSKVAQEWGNVWNIIQKSIIESINKEIDKKYKSIEHKLSKLSLKPTEKPDTNTQFYSRVINETDIDFSNEEMTMLNKGLK